MFKHWPPICAKVCSNIGLQTSSLLRSRQFSESEAWGNTKFKKQMMSTDKYTSIFASQMEAERCLSSFIFFCCAQDRMWQMTHRQNFYSERFVSSVSLLLNKTKKFIVLSIKFNNFAISSIKVLNIELGFFLWVITDFSFLLFLSCNHQFNCPCIYTYVTSCKLHKLWYSM